MTRFVVDCDTLLRIAAGEIEVAAGSGLVETAAPDALGAA